MLKDFLKTKCTQTEYSFCSVKNVGKLPGYIEKMFLLKGLATLSAFMFKIPSFCWLSSIAFRLRNNEQFKTSKTKTRRKFKNNKIQRKCTVSSYKK